MNTDKDIHSTHCDLWDCKFFNHDVAKLEEFKRQWYENRRYKSDKSSSYGDNIFVFMFVAMIFIVCCIVFLPFRFFLLD